NNGTQSSPSRLGLAVWASNTDTDVCATNNIDKNLLVIGTLLFCSQLGPDFGRDMVGELLHSLQIRSFHHDARQRLSARESHQHASGISKRLFGVANGSLHRRQ